MGVGADEYDDVHGDDWLRNGPADDSEVFACSL